MTTDSEIIRRSMLAPEAFAELFDRHARVIGAYARQRIGVDASQDVLSETFLVAFRRRGAFDLTRESARPWLFGIATNLIARHRESEAHRWRSILAAERVAPTDEDHPIIAVEDRMDAAAQLRGLAPRIAALAHGDRDTLLLYAWGGLGYGEVADALGIPVGTVRSRLHRVRRELANEPTSTTLTEGVEAHGPF